MRLGRPKVALILADDERVRLDSLAHRSRTAPPWRRARGSFWRVRRATITTRWRSGCGCRKPRCVSGVHRLSVSASTVATEVRIDQARQPLTRLTCLGALVLLAQRGVPLSSRRPYSGLN